MAKSCPDEHRYSANAIIIKGWPICWIVRIPVYLHSFPSFKSKFRHKNNVNLFVVREQLNILGFSWNTVSIPNKNLKWIHWEAETLVKSWGLSSLPAHCFNILPFTITSTIFSSFSSRWLAWLLYCSCSCCCCCNHIRNCLCCCYWICCCHSRNCCCCCKNTRTSDELSCCEFDRCCCNICFVCELCRLWRWAVPSLEGAIFEYSFATVA